MKDDRDLFSKLGAIFKLCAEKEGIVTKAKYNSINAECLKADEWELLQKTLPTADYES